MPKQFENPPETKVENETDLNESAEENIDRLAEEAASKAAKSEQKFDKNHKLFTN